MTPEDLGQIVIVEGIGCAIWDLVGPVLLGVLLMVIHFAGRQKTETQ